MTVTGISTSTRQIRLQDFSTLLRQGSRGALVKELQRTLEAAGFAARPVDGIFGPKTRAAVLAFQRARGLTADGIVGPRTRSALARVVRDVVDPAPQVPAPVPIPAPGATGVNPGQEAGFQIPTSMLRSGSRGSSVRLLQAALTSLGLDSGPVDGIFGTRTRVAVLAFQRARGLTADGIVGPRTWAALAGRTTTVAPPNTGSGGIDPTFDIETVMGLPVPSAVFPGDRGENVEALQRLLDALGLIPPNGVDGIYGSRTRTGVRHLERILSDTGVATRTDGVFGEDTAAALRGLLADRGKLEPIAHKLTAYAPGQHFPPFSDEARALFREAAALVGLPAWWADEVGLHNILRRESGGYVGRTNYTYGAGMNIERWREVHDELRQGKISARSSATGIGQFLLANVDAYYPGGRSGIGIPLQEAAGMLLYIKARYGSPAAAWTFYTDPDKPHEGY